MKNRQHHRYEIEVDGDALSGLDFRACNVVDLSRPNGGEGQGFAYVFSGTFSECDAWLEAHPDTFELGAGSGR